jgi:LemA protein
MDSIVSLFVVVIQLALFLVVIIGIIVFVGYNKLRGLSELIREAWSNIGAAAKKQADLINKLIELVKSYEAFEGFTMLTISEDVSNAASVATMYQQSGTVLSSVNGLAQKFPELKNNQQYQALMNNMKTCEDELERARVRYNGSVREYNTARSSIPTVFYAHILGFKTADYLEFKGNDQVMDVGSLKSFSDDSGERINALLGRAGGKILEVSNKAIEAGKTAAQKAIEGGKGLADKTQEKIEETPTGQQEIAVTNSPEKQEITVATSPEKVVCASCKAELNADASFCSSCGTKVTT